MSKATRAFILLICISGTLLIAYVRALYLNHVYFNSGLLLIILLTIFLQGNTYTYVFGASAILMMSGNLFFSGIPADRPMLIQHILAICIACLVTFIALFIKRWYHIIEGDRKQMKALFEFANEGIILTDSSGNIILANPEAQRLFQYSASEMLCKPLSLLIPDSNEAGNTTYWAEYFKNPHIHDTREHKNLTGLKKDGSMLPVELSLSYYEQQNTFFALCFITDITRRKEAELRLVQHKEQLEKITVDMRRMNTELENKVMERTLILQEALQELEKSQSELSEALSKEKELNEIKSRFVSMASHEFRTPLSTILSSASLLAKYQQTQDQEKRDKHILRIKSSVQHLNDLLEDFLNLGRLEEEKVSTSIGLFDAKDFLAQVCDELKPVLKTGQQLQLTYNGPEMFTTDKRLLKNVLINLLSNAIKFSDEYKPIEITVINSGSRLMLQVKDHGIGIPKEDMPHLFSTFYRCKNAVNIQGTGLGLHIVKRYIDLLKGQITLSSQINEGTTFNIGLPAQEVSVGEVTG